MREDLLEQLERMFPDGFGIVYTSPDGQIRWAHVNPRGIEQIELLYRTAKEWSER